MGARTGDARARAPVPGLSAVAARSFASRLLPASYSAPSALPPASNGQPAGRRRRARSGSGIESGAREAPACGRAGWEGSAPQRAQAGGAAGARVGSGERASRAAGLQGACVRGRAGRGGACTVVSRGGAGAAVGSGLGGLQTSFSAGLHRPRPLRWSSASRPRLPVEPRNPTECAFLLSFAHLFGIDH